MDLTIPVIPFLTAQDAGKASLRVCYSSTANLGKQETPVIPAVVPVAFRCQLPVQMSSDGEERDPFTQTQATLMPNAFQHRTVGVYNVALRLLV